MGGTGAVLVVAADGDVSAIPSASDAADVAAEVVVGWRTSTSRPHPNDEARVRLHGGSSETRCSVGSREGGDGVGAIGVRRVSLRAEAGVACHHHHRVVEVGDDFDASFSASQAMELEDQRMKRRLLGWRWRRKMRGGVPLSVEDDASSVWRRRYPSALEGGTGGVV